MKAKKKHCVGCETDQFIWKNDKGNKYCKFCWMRNSKKPLKQKKFTPLKFKSKKMIVIDAAYTKFRRDFLEDKPLCEAHLDGCNLQSTDVHHKKGRGEYHLIVNTWLSVCRQCHTWIEEHPKEAIELGYSIKRT